MKRTLMHATCLALMLALPGVVVAQQAERPAKERKAGGNDPVVMNAARDNLAEVQLGKLAAERAASDEVKKFAERMVTDHQKAYDELKQIADSKGLKVPTEPDSRTKKEYDRLAKTSYSFLVRLSGSVGTFRPLLSAICFSSSYAFW